MFWQLLCLTFLTTGGVAFFSFGREWFWQLLVAMLLTSGVAFYSGYVSGQASCLERKAGR